MFTLLQENVLDHQALGHPRNYAERSSPESSRFITASAANDDLAAHAGWLAAQSRVRKRNSTAARGVRCGVSVVTKPLAVVDIAPEEPL